MDALSEARVSIAAFTLVLLAVVAVGPAPSRVRHVLGRRLAVSEELSPPLKGVGVCAGAAVAANLTRGEVAQGDADETVAVAVEGLLAVNPWAEACVQLARERYTYCLEPELRLRRTSPGRMSSIVSMCVPLRQPSMRSGSSRSTAISGTEDSSA